MVGVFVQIYKRSGLKRNADKSKVRMLGRHEGSIYGVSVDDSSEFYYLIFMVGKSSANADESGFYRKSCKSDQISCKFYKFTT